jgi:hypothetical protein
VEVLAEFYCGGRVFLMLSTLSPINKSSSNVSEAQIVGKNQARKSQAKRPDSNPFTTPP